MVLTCPECGQKVGDKNAKGEYITECPFCYHRFTELSNLDDQNKKNQSHDVNYYKKQSVKTNVILNEEELENVLASRRMPKAIKPTQYVMLAVGFSFAVFIWMFIELDSFTGKTFLSKLSFSDQRIVVAIFSAIAGVIMWIPSKNSLKWARLAAVIIAVALPFAVREKLDPAEHERRGATQSFADPLDLTKLNTPVPTKIEDYDKSDLAPLTEEINEAGAKNVMGIWVRGLKSTQVFELSSYLKRMSKTRQEVSFFARIDGGLFVIKDTLLSVDQFLELVTPLGKVNLSDKEHKLIDFNISQSVFKEQAPETTLLNVSSENFISANYDELCSLDSRRILNAAKRLSGTPPRKMRKKVCAQLIKLIEEPWGYDSYYVAALGSALATWAPADDNVALDNVAYVISSLYDAEKDIPQVMVDALVNAKYKDAYLVIVPIWEKSPEKWEPYLIKLQTNVEKSVIAVLKQEDVSNKVKASAIRILEKVGTEDSIPYLEKFSKDSEAQISNSSIVALKAVRKRISEDSSSSTE